MKCLFLFPIILFNLSFHNFSSPRHSVNPVDYSDTTLTHILDGKLTDWPTQMFQTDPATQIKYATDNDGKNLYLALQVPGSRMQMKMMRNGMQVYIDVKGKKKEGKGIEFPVKRDPAADNSLSYYNNQPGEDSSQETAEQRKTRMKAMRAALTLNLTTMKVFGFAADKSDEQGLIMPGSANIAFAWDSADEMCIEYRIPLSLIDASSISQKEVSIGYKLNGFQRSPEHSSAESEHTGRRGGGYGGGGRRNYGGGYSSHSDGSFQGGESDQSFWFKYLIK